MSERRGGSQPLIRSHANQTSSVVPRTQNYGGQLAPSPPSAMLDKLAMWAKAAKEDGICKTGVSAAVDF